ncbi:Cytochrome c oxidase subunit 5A, mitochondrial [Armadillidium nasatum]|uniref:Cytochrome c oxidase subunit 5A, mitochondrial n=1 Tax=Armadillidium nasatum TaxID=96803 RepID=A0A5N5T9X0_9CRUS|nr:Cytochrome c oxidase subunit 5A, mitochondrial [Armadillidium nasatum]
MFRTTCMQVGTLCRGVSLLRNNRVVTAGANRFMSSHSTETDEEFDARYEAYFNRKEIDHWEARKEIRPTLDELGINTPEELGYDKPELALPNVYDVHG